MQKLIKLLHWLLRRPIRWRLRRLERKRTVFEITQEAYRAILDSESNGHYEPVGRYWFRADGKFIGVDNSHGLAFTEEFTSKRLCLSWLLGEFEASDLAETDRPAVELIWTIVWCEYGQYRHERMEESEVALRIQSLIASGIGKDSILAVAPGRLWNPKWLQQTEKGVKVGDMVFEFRATRDGDGTVSTICNEAAWVTDVGERVAILNSISDPGLTFLYLEHLNMIFHADALTVWGYAIGHNQAELFAAQAAAWIFAGQTPQTPEDMPYPRTA